MARANVPKFGNWESEENVPYTVYFDKARKTKVGGKMINPNDPSEYPEMFAHLQPSSLAPTPPPPKPRTRPEEPIGRGAVRPAPDQRSSREDGEFRQLGNSSARTDPNYGPRGQGQRPARSAKHSVGSEQSFERSPLHPHYQKNVTGRGGGSPSLEGKSHDSSHGTPARSRLRPVRADESPEKGAAVPRFGEWDESDPQSAENFTHIFNVVRNEKNTGGAGNAAATPNRSSYAPRKLQSNEPKKCCFPWW